MTQRGSQARVFAEVYYGLTLPRLRIPGSVRQRTKRITTLVIDTACLTDLSVAFSHTWSLKGDVSQIAHDAAHALAGYTDDASRRLRQAIHYDSPVSKAVDIDERDGVYMASYHHGDIYRQYAVGDVRRILARCDLTENERETITLAARERAHSGHVVYATAHRSSRLQQTTHHQPYIFGGLIACSVKLYPGTELAVERLREQGFTIVYASTDSSELVSTLAHAACLTPVSVLPVHSIAHHISLDHQLYAELSEIERKRLVSSYPAETTLVVKHPLPEFEQLIRSLR